MVQQIRSFKDLRVWQEAMELVATAYRLAAKLPESEKFALRPQMCRAAVSIPANIAEGHGSGHRKVYLNHLSISKGSLMELETYALLMEKLRFLSPADLQAMHEQTRIVGKLLNGLIRSLKPRP